MSAATPGQAAYKVRNALAEAVRDAMTGAHDCRARRNCAGCTARYDAVMNLADRYAAAAPEPQPAPGDLPRGHFEHLQRIGVIDNLRSQLTEAHAENARLRTWLVGIMRGNDAEIDAARMQADEWITEEGL